MATSNITATQDWTKVADSTDDHLLISTSASAYEVATTSADVAPSAGLRGHLIDYGEAVSRLLIGPGYVWARNVGPNDANLVVSK